MNALLHQVLAGQTLSAEAMTHAMEQLLSGEVSPEQIAAFLTALRMRGETVDELTGAARAVRHMATRITVPHRIVVDTCGTGGDARGTFNISTASAIVASACGVTVAKHGNRSVSSRCGSADVLEALGVRIELAGPQLEKLIQVAKLGFLFAPAHHPAFKHVAHVRKELGFRTLFNLVGPLANPAGANRQVLGVFAPAWVPMMADVLAQLGTEKALVVHGDGLDEVSVCGPTQVSSLTFGERQDFEVTPEMLGLARHPMDALRGGDATTNATIIRHILEGQHGAPRDAVLANTAAALLVGDVVSDWREGVQLAAEVVDSGAANAHFERFLRLQHGVTTLLDDIVAALPMPALRVQSTPGTSNNRLRNALSPRHGPTRIIAEVKRKSPSAGLIADIPNPGALASRYQEEGAAAISVLTNGPHFGGHLDDLAAVRRAVTVPVLRKEFITHPRQLHEAALAGADAVLLIATVLGSGLRAMMNATHALGLDALVEVHDESELQLALKAGATLIGVNNRDLRTFVVDLSVSERLAAQCPENVTLVAESGVKSEADIARLRQAGIANFLVGEFLVRGGQL